MERRGFIESLAKAAAGAMLSPQSLLGKEETQRDRLLYLPRVIKITDETLLDSQNNLVLPSLKASLQAGFSALYPDIVEKDFIDTLFPGLLEGAYLGLNVYFPQEPCSFWDKIVAGIIATLTDMPHKESVLDPAFFVPWQGAVKQIDSSDSALIRLKTPADFPIDEALDIPLELSEAALIPCPALSRRHQFQIGLVCGISEYSGENHCRDLFLSCFIQKDHSEWFKDFDQAHRWSLFERLSYPQGMKFRLFIVERLQAEKSVYLCGDGVILDKHFSFSPDEDLHKHIKLVRIMNPSAPLNQAVNWKRRGSDNVLHWSDEDYSGRWQIYRSREEGLPPTKNNLIGITANSAFIDAGAALTGHWYYTVTRKWGE